ncbi:acyltransferase [Calidifontibacter sp. DB0510]|uniref:Acyltransferase n=1 Tax=Metallococcus carri TaxID=1656884 RepID=A0A967E887_9MICO|nr:acyltransferase [Metallococcus carri]NHN54962.1 acyltransferase [Metallococcus carri]NOP37308.1 acyltransferase [Calidifontibacter sp. DB2511S]
MAHQHKSLPYRPALDGLRGIAVTTVVLFHLGVSWMRGGWLGVDLFFVLSGFLITSLLMAEHDRWGSIDLLGFWTARARRLLPALVTMLLAVLALSSVWTLASRRASVALDTLSALFYVANWRMLLSDDAYFETLSLPSPLKHTWSLSIEEQYYLIYPLLLSVLLAITARVRGRMKRRRVLAAILLALAAVSVWRMVALYQPGTDPSRVYYGTDTRAFELLIGAAAGVLLGRHDFGRRTTRPGALDRFAAWAAVPALVIFLAACVVVDDSFSAIFQGLLAALCLIAVIPIAASAGRYHSPVQRLLSVEPLRRLGLISYSLYLWHFPVIVFLNPQRLSMPWLPRAMIQAALSVGLAYLTYRYVETPIRRRGFAGLLPGRPAPSRVLAWCAVPLIVLGAFLMPRSAWGDTEIVGDTSKIASTPLTYTPAPYVPLAKPHVVTLIGNSIPDSLAAVYPQSAHPDIYVQTTVNDGCDPFPGTKLIGGEPQQITPQCRAWQGRWTVPITNGKPSLALFFVPQSFVSDYQLNGRTVRFGTPEYARFISDSLTTVRDKSLQAGAKKFAVTTLACHNLPFADVNKEFALINQTPRVIWINGQVRTWATANKVPVIDQYGFLCTGGYHDKINDAPLYKDGLHFTEESGPIMWSWLAPQLQRLIR